MKKVGVQIILFSILISSCASTYVPYNDGKVSLIRDRAFVYPISEGKSMALFAEVFIIEEDLLFKVAIKNRSNSPIVVRDTDFKVYTSKGFDKKGTEIRVLDSDKFLKMVKFSAAADRAGLALLGVASVLTLAAPVTTRTSGTISSSAGNVGTYKSISTTRDPARAASAMAGISSDIQAQNARGMSYIDFLAKNLFFSTTIQPGEEYYGIIACQQGSYNLSIYPYFKYIRISLDIDGDHSQIIWERE